MTCGRLLSYRHRLICSLILIIAHRTPFCLMFFLLGSSAFVYHYYPRLFIPLAIHDSTLHAPTDPILCLESCPPTLTLSFTTALSPPFPVKRLKKTCFIAIALFLHTARTSSSFHSYFLFAHAVHLRFPSFSCIIIAHLGALRLDVVQWF